MLNGMPGSPAPPQTLRELTDSVNQQLSHGVSSDVVVKQLLDRGWPEVTARQFVANAARNAGAATQDAGSSAERRQIAELYKRRMFRGLAWTLGGLAITLVSLDLARYNGGVSFFCFGAILFGFIDFLTALAGWWRYRK